MHLNDDGHPSVGMLEVLGVSEINGGESRVSVEPNGYQYDRYIMSIPSGIKVSIPSKDLNRFCLNLIARPCFEWPVLLEFVSGCTVPLTNNELSDQNIDTQVIAGLCRIVAALISVTESKHLKELTSVHILLLCGNRLTDNPLSPNSLYVPSLRLQKYIREIDQKNILYRCGFLRKFKSHFNDGIEEIFFNPYSVPIEIPDDQMSDNVRSLITIITEERQRWTA